MTRDPAHEPQLHMSGAVSPPTGSALATSPLFINWKYFWSTVKPLWLKSSVCCWDSQAKRKLHLLDWWHSRRERRRVGSSVMIREGSGGQCVICQPNGDELSSKETSQLSQCQRLMISEPSPGLEWSWPPSTTITSPDISLHLLAGISSQICWWPLLNSYLTFLTLLSNTDISKIFRPLKIFNKITPEPSEISETWALP